MCKANTVRKGVIEEDLQIQLLKQPILQPTSIFIKYILRDLSNYNAALVNYYL